MKFVLLPLFSATLFFLVSCAEKKTSKQQLEELNHAQEVLLIQIGLLDHYEVFGTQSDEIRLAIHHNMLRGEEPYGEVIKADFEKFKTSDIDFGFSPEVFDTINNFIEFSDVAVKASAKIIRDAKPSDKELKDAYEKLGDIHSKFEATMATVKSPPNLSSFNDSVKEFGEELSIFMSWWKREVASQVE